ncbi:cation diffusion facilitator family transporter [uncultured Jatrophihabitans sp.]|uniref:cation diffusion facilitator family transporter n=1 Tax=uncultured Jatrophihabitans sp. TaxID=1610747 RepID=UPI0035CB872B
MAAPRGQWDSGRVGHGHEHGTHVGAADRRWLLASLGVILVFMVAEVVAGLLANSLALIADAGHMLTDAAALGLAVIASRIAERPARGAFTYGFARVDALSGQANGITLLLLAVWFVVEGVRRLLDPAEVQGGIVVVVAAIGAGVSVLATWLAGRADRSGLNVRGVLAHLLNDVWAFGATLVSGVVVLTTGWLRADAVATFVVAGLMAWTGTGLVRAANRVFLEAAPQGLDPADIGGALVAGDGVAEVHDLHVWNIGASDTALSAHVLVDREYDCHAVSAQLRALLAERYGISHVTLQVDHADAQEHRAHRAEQCTDSHGVIHSAPGTLR